MEQAFAPKKRTSAARVYGNRGVKRRETTKDEGERKHESDSTPESSRCRTPETSYGAKPRHKGDWSSPATISSLGSTPQSAPSTPRKRGRQGTTPSSSPLVKLDLGKEVFQLLSPKKEKNVRRFASHDEDDQNSDESDSSSPLSLGGQIVIAARSPSRSSFAARMAPKDTSLNEAKASTSSYDAPHSTVLSVVKRPGRSPSHLSKQDWQAIESSTTAPQARRRAMRTYGMQSNFATDENLDAAPKQQADACLEELAGLPPDVSAMRARWTDLDDMESEDEGEVNVKSITRLRSAGVNRRFLEDFDYLVSDLQPKQRLGTKQSACTDIARRALGMDDESMPNEGEQQELTEHRCEVPPTTSSDFLLNLCTADVTERLCAGLRHVRRGQPTDVVVDMAVAIVYARLVADVNLLRQLTSQTAFVNSLSDILQARYDASPSAKSRQGLAELHTLVRCSQCVPEHYGQITPSVVAAHSLVTLLSCSTLDMHPTDWGIAQLKETLWSAIGATIKTMRKTCDGDTLFERANYLDMNGSALILIDLVAQSLDVIMNRFSLSNSMSPESIILDTTSIIAILARHTERPINDRQFTLHAAALSSCLKLLVEVLRDDADEGDMQAVMLASKIASASSSPEENFIGHIAALIDTAARLADDAVNVSRSLRLLDVSTLALGVLTKLLEADPQVARCYLMKHGRHEERKESIIGKLGRLFSERDQQRDKADQAGLFANCLAVALALMVVSGHTEDSRNIEGADEDRKRVALELSKGMNLRPDQHLRHVLADNLDCFATSTSDGAATGLSTEVRSEDSLVRHLSIRLRNN